MANAHVPFDQVASVISAFGTKNRILLEGSPGIGKSSMMTQLKQTAQFKDHHAAFVDCACLGLGDTAMPVIDHENMVTRYAPNALFGLSKKQERPSLIFLDELGKASREVLNMLAPLIQDGRIGDTYLTPGSVVVSTTNLSTDALGDAIPDHIYNRMTTITMGGPTPENWIQWAMNNDISPVLAAAVKIHPDMLDTYNTRDSDALNPYIFNPMQGNNKFFCSARSLANCSDYLKAFLAGSMSRDITYQLLRGTVGEAGAASLMTVAQLRSALPTPDEIRADPAKAYDKLQAAGLELDGQWLMLSTLISAAQDTKDVEQFSKFIQMLEHEEVHFLYATVMMGVQRLAAAREGSQAYRVLVRQLSKIQTSAL